MDYSDRGQIILEAAEEPYWEENSAGRFQAPVFETYPRAAKPQPGPASRHHTSEMEHSVTAPSHHAGTAWDACVFYHSPEGITG
jgi:hypothetical protein